jgi:hypothetical protein
LLLRWRPMSVRLAAMIPGLAVLQSTAITKRASLKAVR